MSDMIHLSSGQVGFPVNLMRLPGSDSIGIDLVYTYERAIATYPNVLAPTGVCGLGWGLARRQIITDPGLSSSPSGLGFAVLDPSGPRQLMRDRDLRSDVEDRIGFRMAVEPTTRAFLNRRTNSWEVQTGDGTVYIYGDEKLPGTVEYDLGFANWRGATNNPATEERVAVAWNLARIRTAFGQEYVFHYDSDEAGVTGAAGENRTYTRATYLTRIIGPGRDELVLTYGDRESFEYKPFHGSQADVFRDSFVTRYLQSVRLYSPDGRALSETQLIYKENGKTVFLGSDDSNRKRLLMGISRGEVVVDTDDPGPADIIYAPDTLFDYWGRVPGDGVSPEHVQNGSALYGALKSATGLTGATQTFDYTTIDGGASAREIAIAAGGLQNVFFAEDYALLTSFADGKGVLQPVVRAGRWIESPSVEATMSQEQYSAATVALSDENFAVLVAGKVHLFGRDGLRPDRWITTSFPVSADAAWLVAGNGFVSLVDGAQLVRYTLRASALAGEPPVWVEIRGVPAPVRAARQEEDPPDLTGCNGRDNFILRADYWNASGKLEVVLDFLENNGQWNSDSQLPAMRSTATAITPARPASELLVEAGEGFAVISLRYPASMGTNDAKYLMCQWDANFRELELHELTDRSRPVQQPAPREDDSDDARDDGGRNPRQDTLVLPYSVATVRGGTLSIDQSAFRVIGDKKPVESEIVMPPARAAVYAPDLLLFETPAGSGKSHYRLLEFVPGTDRFQETIKLEANQGLPMAAAGQTPDAEEADYILLGGTVYYRNWNATPGETGLWQPVSGVTPGAGAKGATFGAGYFVYEEGGEVQCYALIMEQANAAFSTAGTLLGAGPTSFAVNASGTTTLYWFEDGLADGLISTYPAGMITSFDGERTLATKYEYADGPATVSKGAIVPAGDPVYNRVIRKSGGKTGQGTPLFDQGRVEHYFYTGPEAGRGGTADNYAAYPPDSQGDHQYPYNSEVAAGAVTGQCYIAKTFDERDVEQAFNQTEYWAYRNPVGALSSGRFADSGIFVRLYKTTSSRQSVSNYMDYSYDGQGRLVSERSRNVDQQGRDQTRETQFLYFDHYRSYSGSGVRVNLSDVVVTRTTRVTTHDLKGDIVSYPSTEVTTFRDWSPELSSRESWAPFKSYRYIKDAKEPGNSDEVVNEDAENPTISGAPAGWELLETVVSRSAGGMPVVGRDQAGVYYSNLYDEVTGRMPVAGFSGARIDLDQCSYVGFETYEPSNFDGWVGPGGLPLNTGIRDDDSAIGKRSYYMQAGGVGPRRVMRPDFRGETEPQAFVFSCFVKTETGYNGGARWIVEAYHNGTKIEVSGLNLDIPETGQRWKYIQKVIVPDEIRKGHEFGTDRSLDYVLNADNSGGAGAVRLDQLRFAPVDGSFGAMAYDFDRKRITAGTATNGEIRRDLFASGDSTGAVVTNNGGGSALNERVASMKGGSLARLISGTAQPDVNLPDHSFTTGPGDMSAYIDFRNQRESDWDFSSGTWAFADGALACASAGTAVFNDFAVGAFALRLRIVKRSGSVSITTGGAGSFVLTRNDSGWQLNPGDGSPTLRASATGPGVNEDLLFARLDGLLVLYASGRQIFAVAADGGQAAGASKVEIESGAGSSFVDFTLTDSPPGSFSIQDGGGRPVQTLAVLGRAPAEGELAAGVRAIISGGLYDELGRGYLERRPVTTNLVYANSRLKAQPETYLAAPTGVTVDLNTYLDGTTEANGTKIIDYSRTYFQDSPILRPTKTEKPRGADEQAALYTEHNEPFSDVTCDVFEDLVKAPPGGKGRYGIGQEYNGTGSEGYGLADQWGQVLYHRIVMDNGYLTTGKEYDDAGNVVKELPPNYFLPPAGSDPDDWISTYTYDVPRGLMLSEKSRDRGLTQLIYDSAGRPRFRQDARNEAAGQVVYTKYDRVSRPIEIGTVPWTGTWEDLQAKADTPDWPSSGNTFQKQFAYDYDRSQPDAMYLLGRLRSTNINNGDNIDVETRSYDALGKTNEHVLSVPDFDQGNPQTTTYVRDQTGRVTTIEYPAAAQGADGLKVGYYYDRSGRLSSIGEANATRAPEQQRYSAYTYDRMGRIIDEALNGAADPAAQFTRSIGFNPAGFTVTLEDEYWSETIDYDKSIVPGEQGQFNGRINSTAFEYKPDRWDCPPSNYDYKYDYDKSLRLTRAKHSREESNSIVFAADEINLTGGFDPNGNLLSYKRGLSRRDYSYTKPLQPPPPGEDASPSKPDNRVYGMNATTDVTFDPAVAVDGRAGDFVWGSSNGGPSATKVNAPAIDVAGASPGRYEYLRLQSYLEQRGTYQLTYDIKVAEGFNDSTAGACGWFMTGKTPAGEIVEVQLAGVTGATTEFTTATLSIDLSALIAGATHDEPLDEVRLEFRNGRWIPDGGPAPAISLQNINLVTGEMPLAIGAYEYDAVGATTKTPELSELKYNPVTYRPASINVLGPDSPEVSFSYGAANQRIRKQVKVGSKSDSASRWYLHGGRARPLVRLDRDDGGDAPGQARPDGVSYIYGPGGLIAIQGQGGLHFALKDHLGSTRVLVNDKGEVDRYYDYLPYGGLMRTGRTAPESGNEHRYTGQEKDGETGLYNYRARLYDSDLRRFLTTDPKRRDESPYSYVAGNPISLTDPTGRSPEGYADVMGWILSFLLHGAAAAMGVPGHAFFAVNAGIGIVIWFISLLRLGYFLGNNVVGGAVFKWHRGCCSRRLPSANVMAGGYRWRYLNKRLVRAMDPAGAVMNVIDPITRAHIPAGAEIVEVNGRYYWELRENGDIVDWGLLRRWYWTNPSVSALGIIQSGLAGPGAVLAIQLLNNISGGSAPLPTSARYLAWTASMLYLLNVSAMSEIFAFGLRYTSRKFRKKYRTALILGSQVGLQLLGQFFTGLAVAKIWKDMYSTPFDFGSDGQGRTFNDDVDGGDLALPLALTAAVVGWMGFRGFGMSKTLRRLVGLPAEGEGAEVQLLPQAGDAGYIAEDDWDPDEEAGGYAGDIEMDDLAAIDD